MLVEKVNVVVIIIVLEFMWLWWLFCFGVSLRIDLYVSMLVSSYNVVIIVYVLRIFVNFKIIVIYKYINNLFFGLCYVWEVMCVYKRG